MVEATIESYGGSKTSFDLQGEAFAKARKHLLQVLTDALLAEIVALRERGIGRVYYNRKGETLATITEEDAELLRGVWLDKDDPLVTAGDIKRLWAEYCRRMGRDGCVAGMGI